MSTVFRTVVTVRHELVHEARTAGEADLVAKRLVGSQPGIREAQIAQVISRPLSVVEQLQRQNLTAWQESEAVRGDPALYDRWAHNLLPEEELLVRVRRTLFTPMDSIKRRRRMNATAIPHPRALTGTVECAPFDDLDHLVTWKTTALADTDRAQYAQFCRIDQSARLIADHPWLSMSPADCVTTHLREHMGTCSVCKRTATQRSVLVAVQWAGRTLSREYAL